MSRHPFDAWTCFALLCLALCGLLLALDAAQVLSAIPEAERPASARLAPSAPASAPVFTLDVIAARP